MNIIKDLNKYELLMLSGFILWILESWAFGWNEKPCCILERILDVITMYMMIYGVMGDIAITVASKAINKTRIVANIDAKEWEKALNNIKK